MTAAVPAQARIRRRRAGASSGLWPAAGKRAPAPVRIPLPPRRLRALLFWTGGSLLAAAVLAWSAAAGLDRRLKAELLAASARAGFTARQVQILGARQQDRLSIYAAVLDQDSDALLALDLEAIRARIEALPWVAEARVLRRWPDTIVVEVTERRPLAVWQLRGRFAVIDTGGALLPAADPARFRHLPLVVGPGADRAAPALLALLGAWPAIGRDVVAAVFVGERRWDLRLLTGETLSLPEGPEAARALARLAALERETPVRGRGFLRLDLRVPDRLVIRLSPEQQEAARRRAQDEAARAAAAAAATPAPAAGGGGPAPGSPAPAVAAPAGRIA